MPCAFDKRLLVLSLVVLSVHLLGVLNKLLKMPAWTFVVPQVSTRQKNDGAHPDSSEGHFIIILIWIQGSLHMVL